MLCCLKFLYGGTNGSGNVAMKVNQNNIQLDTTNMGRVFGNNMALKNPCLFDDLNLL